MSQNSEQGTVDAQTTPTTAVKDTGVSQAAPPGNENTSTRTEESPSDVQINSDTKPESGKVDDSTPPKPEGEGEPKSTEVTQKEIDGVVGFVEEAGLDMRQVVQEVNENGGKVTPEILKALEEKHGVNVAKLIADQISALHDKRVEQRRQADKAVFDQVQEAFKGTTDQSGEETWKELAAWAEGNIENADRAELNTLLSGGGLGAKLAVQELISAFKSSPQYTQPIDLVSGSATGSTAKDGFITRKEYTDKLDELLRKGHNYNTSPEIKRLEAQRTRSIANGI